MTTKAFLKILILLSFMVLFNSTECITKATDDGECSKNRNVVNLSGELLVNGSPMWDISVAKLNGAILDADKNCHAQMTLEFWFKDKKLAKTTVKPPLSIVFYGGGGFFDPGSVATFETLRMTDSTYYWTAFCDQAAKNAPENPINYGISVTWDLNQSLSLEDVGLSGIIDYKIYKKP
jgi:hypothetical protein